MQSRNEKVSSKFVPVPQEMTLCDALKLLGLLKEPSSPKGIGMHLIREGELGLSLNNGRPYFLAPGRHTLWSPLNKFIKRVSITDKYISLGPIQIVTLEQGELGLSKKNGENIILTEPGRYILVAPHVFVKTVAANEEYIELGTHHRISVPQGYVAIAFVAGKQIIISPNDTKHGPYITDSPTFLFDPEDPNAGFQSTQIKETKLEELVVNTKENIAVKVIGIIRYHINNPHIAFFEIENVHAAIKLQAEATLTSVFAQLSIDQISTSLSTTNVSSLKGKEKESDVVPSDFIHTATDLFIKEFKNVVEKWGVVLDNLNILGMSFVEESFRDTLRHRAEKWMNAGTDLANVKLVNDVATSTTEREKRQRIIQAESEAEAIRIKADAKLYEADKHAEAAEILSQTPLASQLALLNAQKEIVEKMGDKTVFISHDLAVAVGAAYGNQGMRGMTLFNQNNRLARNQNDRETMQNEVSTKRRLSVS